MQKIDHALDDLVLREPLDSRYYFPRNAKRAARKIRDAAPCFGDADNPARKAAEALASAVDEYADEIEKLFIERADGEK